MLVAIGIAVMAAGWCFGAIIAACGFLLQGVGTGIAGTLVALVILWLDSRVYTVYGADDDTPYLTRLVLGRLRLHIFWRGDADPDPHDHPWNFWTFPLTPYLEEVVLDPEDAARWSDLLGVPDGVFKHLNLVTAWRWHYRPATYLHRVLGAAVDRTTADSPFVRTEVEPGRPIITIVWTERTSRDWGFLKNRDGEWCWVEWRKYIYEGGKHAPCEPREFETVSRVPMEEPNP